jgi:drug/metabolite transporter, DME family
MAVLLWSTGGLFIKIATLDAQAINCGRSLFAALTVALFTYKKGLRADLYTMFTALIYAGILSCFVYATKTTTAANAIFLQYTAPIYILILSPLLLKERFRLVDLITVFFCLAGMSLFFIERPGTASEHPPNHLAGDLAALLSGALFGLYFVLLRHPRTRKHPNPAISVFYGNLLVVMLMLPFLIGKPPQPTAADFLTIAYLGIFQIGLSYILFTFGLVGGVRSFDASIIGFVEPLLNPLWVFLVVGETPGKWAMLGGALILLTVATHTILQNRFEPVRKENQTQI